MGKEAYGSRHVSGSTFYLLFIKEVFVGKIYAIKIIICFMLIQSAFADICDFEYTWAYYTDRFGANYYDDLGPPPTIVDGGDPTECPEDLIDTITTGVYPGGQKVIQMSTLLGGGCHKIETKLLDSMGNTVKSSSEQMTILRGSCRKIEMKIFDSMGNTIKSNSHIIKGEYTLQITEDGITRNVIHTDTPCDFTLLDTSSGESTAFHFDGSEKDSALECKKIAKNLPEQFCFFISSQIGECEKYTRYMEYMEEHLKNWETLFK